MKPSTTLLTISEIFKDRFFKIPDYQRGYSWETDPQLHDLKDDIENLFKRNYRHFTGTIVAAIDKKNHHFYIIDGQQRLTTILILLKVIWETDKEKYKEIPHLYFTRGAVGEERSVLEPNEETREFFNDLFHNGIIPNPKIKSEKNILEAYRYFQKWVNASNAEEIYNTLKKKLGFILFTPDDDKEIGIMFEVINNRGKQLSELEKIKNYFIYFATIKEKETLRKTINDKWKKLQENLSHSGKTSNNDENNFLRYTYLVFYDPAKAKSHNVYDNLKETYSPTETVENVINDYVLKMGEYVQFLCNASLFYKYLYVEQAFSEAFGNQKAYRKINKSLTYLRCHPVNASIMPLYLAIMHSFHKPSPKGMDEETRNERIADLLELLEKANFRLYLLPGVFARADSKQSDLFRMANEFFSFPEWTSDDEEPDVSMFDNSKEIFGNIFDWLESELTDMVKINCPIPRFIDALTISRGDIQKDLYYWRDSGLRYFLARYEDSLKHKARLSFDFSRVLKKRDDVKENSNMYLSVEHIWARGNKSQDFDQYEKEKRRLGNLALMGMIANIKQTNDDITDKVDRLVKENEVGTGSLDMHQIAELRSIMNRVLQTPHIQSWKRKTKYYYRDLSMIMNDIRENKLIKFALKTWKVKGEKENDFVEVDSVKANGRERYYYLKEDL